MRALASWPRLFTCQAESGPLGLRRVGGHTITDWSDVDGDLAAIYENYAVSIQPVITKMSDDRWRAQYPGVDWHVVTDTEAAAGDELVNEALRRADAGLPDAQPPHDILKRHLDKPIPGVFALDRELFLYLRTHEGVAKVQLAFEEAERRRATGQPYTKADYLAEQAGPP